MFFIRKVMYMKKIWIVGMMVFLPLSVQAMTDEAEEEIKQLFKPKSLVKTPKFLQIGIVSLDQEIIPVQKGNLPPKKKVSFEDESAQISQSLSFKTSGKPVKS